MTYEEALAEARSAGLSKCSDAAAMASFCGGTIQILVGAVSGKLVWQGAMKNGLTYRQLAEIAHKGWHGIDELQWVA